MDEQGSSAWLRAQRGRRRRVHADGRGVQGPGGGADRTCCSMARKLSRHTTNGVVGGVWTSRKSSYSWKAAAVTSDVVHTPLTYAASRCGSFMNETSTANSLGLSRMEGASCACVGLSGTPARMHRGGGAGRGQWAGVATSVDRHGDVPAGRATDAQQTLVVRQDALGGTPGPSGPGVCACWHCRRQRQPISWESIM